MMNEGKNGRTVLNAGIQMAAAGSITSQENTESCMLFLQWDKRWGYVPYGQSNIGISECGPACLSMVLYGLTRDKNLTPDALAGQAMNGGSILKGLVVYDRNTASIWRSCFSGKCMGSKYDGTAP